MDHAYLQQVKDTYRRLADSHLLQLTKGQALTMEASTALTEELEKRNLSHALPRYYKPELPSHESTDLKYILLCISVLIVGFGVNLIIAFLKWKGFMFDYLTYAAGASLATTFPGGLIGGWLGKRRHNGIYRGAMWGMVVAVLFSIVVILAHYLNL